MNYKQYHQKCGFYAIPVEIFDGLCEEKEIMQLKEMIKNETNDIRSNANT